MPATQLFIQKFGKVVTIDEDHPLAVAQRAADTSAKNAQHTQHARSSGSAGTADTCEGEQPAAPVPPESADESGVEGEAGGEVEARDAVKHGAESAATTDTPKSRRGRGASR